MPCDECRLQRKSYLYIIHAERYYSSNRGVLIPHRKQRMDSCPGKNKIKQRGKEVLKSLRKNVRPSRGEAFGENPWMQCFTMGDWLHSRWKAFPIIAMYSSSRPVEIVASTTIRRSSSRYFFVWLKKQAVINNTMDGAQHTYIHIYMHVHAQSCRDGSCHGLQKSASFLSLGPRP